MCEPKPGIAGVVGRQERREMAGLYVVRPDKESQEVGALPTLSYLYEN